MQPPRKKSKPFYRFAVPLTSTRQTEPEAASPPLVLKEKPPIVKSLTVSLGLPAVAGINTERNGPRCAQICEEGAEQRAIAETQPHQQTQPKLACRFALPTTSTEMSEIIKKDLSSYSSQTGEIKPSQIELRFAEAIREVSVSQPFRHQTQYRFAAPSTDNEMSAIARGKQCQAAKDSSVYGIPLQKDGSSEGKQQRLPKPKDFPKPKAKQDFYKHKTKGQNSSSKLSQPVGSYRFGTPLTDSKMAEITKGQASVETKIISTVGGEKSAAKVAVAEKKVAEKKVAEKKLSASETKQTLSERGKKQDSVAEDSRSTGYRFATPFSSTEMTEITRGSASSPRSSKLVGEEEEVRTVGTRKKRSLD